MTVWLIFLDKFQFEVTVVCTYPTAVTIVVDILCNEYRREVSRAKWLELF